MHMHQEMGSYGIVRYGAKHWFEIFIKEQALLGAYMKSKEVKNWG